jgi:hypothetical protein
MSRPWFGCARVPFALLLFALAAPAFGLTGRTFVASYGNDSNPCSLPAPCRSFNFAIAQTNSGGEVVVLDSGGYGPATITQSVSIIAPAGVYAGISVISPANTVGVTINAAGIKVVLQNLAINGLGGTYGVLLQQAAEVDINNCTVSNFVGANIYSTAANTKLSVRDTLVRDSIGASAKGVWLIGSTRAVLERVRVVHSGSDGVRAEAGADVSVKRSVLAGNAGSGLYVTASAGVVVRGTIEDSLIADNGSDGLTATSTGAGAVAEISAARNTITRNTDYGVAATAIAGSGQISLSDNLISQNGFDGVYAIGAGAVVTSNANTFAGNGASALDAQGGGTIHTVKGADGLPNNAGVQTTPTIGNVVPANAF